MNNVIIYRLSVAARGSGIQWFFVGLWQRFPLFIMIISMIQAYDRRANERSDSLLMLTRGDRLEWDSITSMRTLSLMFRMLSLDLTREKNLEQLMTWTEMMKWIAKISACHSIFSLLIFWQSSLAEMFPQNASCCGVWHFRAVLC